MVRSTRPAVRDFIRREGGAVTVDYSVLLTGVVGVAIALAAYFTSELLQLNYNVGARLQQRETRPSFAYRPYDADVHRTFATLFSTLTDDELGQMSAWGNATRAEPPVTTEAELETYRDLDNAITAVYGSRSESRGESRDYDAALVERIVGKLGLADASLLD